MRKLTYVFLAFAILMIASPVYAQTATGANAGTNWVAITAGFSMAIAAGLGALGQGKIAASAAEAMARNPGARPGIMVMLILGLAFVESLALFTFAMIFAKVK